MVTPTPKETAVPGFTHRQLIAVVGALVIAVLLAALDTTVLTTALPTIAGEFGKFEHFAWVGTAYIATATMATPILGRLSDIFGRRSVFTATMAVFLIGSLLCGLAQSMNQLIAFRVIQGIGGGAIQPLAFATLGDLVPPRERGRYIGYFTIAFAGSAIGGPLIGGVIVEHWSWPWIFFVQIPPGLAAMVMCHRALKLPFTRREARIDWLGALLLSVSLGCAIFGLEQGRSGWTSATVLTLLGSSVVAGVLFVLQELRAPEPIIPMSLFTNAVVRQCILLGMAAGAFTFGTNAFLPLYFQDARFVSPTRSGLWMLPQIVGVVLGTFFTGRLVAKSGRYKKYPIVGSIMATVGLAAFTRIDASTRYLSLLVPMLLVGVGVSSIFTVTSIATQNAVDFRDLGVATATIMLFRTLGGALSLAVNGALLNSTIRTQVPRQIGVTADEAARLIRTPEEIRALDDAQRSAVIDALSTGVSRIFIVSVVVVAAGCVAAWRLPERPLRARAAMSDALESAANPAP